ncbi:MAG: PhnD/SsuA/transferrin family substrate-binding protein [Gammaproteobacteria bacterium]|nr:PhnD/SsuA/transferrin family substrate-binding protein [Gammaproteobacteria bacterium]
MQARSILIGFVAFFCISFTLPAAADSNAAKNAPPMQVIAAAIKKAAFVPSSPAPIKNNSAEHIAQEQDVIVFTAPPRESPEEAQEIYQPIAEYLSRTIGKKVIYKNAGTWGVYRTEMLKGSYDLVFDGPHFNSYRMEKLSHNILVKIPERHEFVVIVRKDQAISGLAQMAGRTFCAHAPPNLGTLVLLSQFDNPARQPVILSTNGWDNIYQGVMSGKCMGGVLPMANLKKFDRANAMKVVFKTQAMPNQAFSAGPRISAEDQMKITQALTSVDASAVTAKLRAAYKVGDSFTQANNQEYQGLAEYLRNEWGYY